VGDGPETKVTHALHWGHNCTKRLTFPRPRCVTLNINKKRTRRIHTYGTVQ
jgi:hypothetical protein